MPSFFLITPAGLGVLWYIIIPVAVVVFFLGLRTFGKGGF